MKTTRQAVLLAIALMGVWAGKGLSLELPELISQLEGAAGTFASGTNAEVQTALSPVLDDGNVFFLSSSELIAFDTNGVIDLYRNSVGTIAGISVAALGTWSGNVAQAEVATDGETVALLREPSAFSDYPKVLILRQSGSLFSESTLDDNPDATSIALSADGAYLAFVTPNDGLSPFDANGRSDLFYCPLAETSALQYVATAAAPSHPSMSSDGAKLAFVAGGALYLHDTGALTTSAISEAGTGVTSAMLAAGGEWIVFCSAESLGDDSDGLSDVFRVRADGSNLERVSLTPKGSDFVVAAGANDVAVISEDGRYVAFTAPVPGGSVPQVWVRDTQLERTECASVGTDNAVANAGCGAPALSADGSWLTFSSAATNLSAAANGVRQVYGLDLGDGWGTSAGVAPSGALVDDFADIIGWQWVEGHQSAAEYEISLDGGITWTVADGNPWYAGNVDVAAGAILIRLYATSTVGSGDSLVVAAGMTAIDQADLPAWAVAVTCPTLGVDAVVGMADSALQTASALPTEDGGICLLGVDDAPLARSVVPTADEADWRIVIRSPDDAGSMWYWTLPPGFSADRYLSLWEVDAEGEPVGATALEMGHTKSLILGAGEERYFVLRYADDRTIDVALIRGWNQVSLPVTTESAAIASVFADTEGTALVEATGMRATDGLTYESVTEIAALDKVWVYAFADSRLLVRGAPAEQVEAELSVGWNLVVVSHAVALASLDIDLETVKVLEWHTDQLRYGSAETLLPSRVYWVKAEAAQTLSLLGN